MATKTEKTGADARAKARLIERHQAEFYNLKAEEYEAIGETFERPLTEEEQAAKTVRQLVEKYPSLAGQVAPVVRTDPGSLSAEGEERVSRALAAAQQRPAGVDDDVVDDGEIPEGSDPWGDNAA